MPEAINAKKPTPVKKPKSIRRRLLEIFAVFFILMAVLLISIGLVISSEVKSHTAPITVLPKNTIVQLHSSLLYQDFLQYGNASTVVPYALLNINTTNATSISASVEYLHSSPPTSVYILNWSGECLNCGNVTALVGSLSSNLAALGMKNLSKIQIINQQNVTDIKNNSVLVVLNGLLPVSLLGNTSQGTVLDTLFSKGTTVIYIGQSFSRLIASQGVIVPGTNLPSYLTTESAIPNSTISSFSFYQDQRTFNFVGGDTYNPITYEAVGKGYMLAFSNYLTSGWSNQSSAGRDIADTIFYAFWLPAYSYGFTTFEAKNITRTDVDIGVIAANLSKVSESSVTGSYARVVTAAYSPYGVATYYIYSFQPQASSNGTISIPTTMTPKRSFNGTITVLVNSTQLVEPHLSIYNLNFTPISSNPPLFAKQISPPSYVVLTAFNYTLPSGGYIMQLQGFNGHHYASAYITVPRFDINLISSNSSGYLFSVTAGGVPLNDLNATVTINGEYPTNAVITNGMMFYSVPSAANIQTTTLNFVITILGESFGYSTFYTPPPPVSINPQYVEFVIAMMVVILEITLIKAPTRDEFFIDVPIMPTPTRLQVKVNYTELLNVFDKLNVYYHWKFMPLSKQEFRVGVSNNVHSGGMPILLTYKNIDAILDELTTKGYLISVDELYAPKAWVDQSKHDIEYLATFKKLRVYLVSHAHVFTDLDKSDAADITTTLHNERAYIVIYSGTSKFAHNIPIRNSAKTYLAFLNSDRLEEFKKSMFYYSSKEGEELKMYISSGMVELIDADNPEGILT